MKKRTARFWHEELKAEARSTDDMSGGEKWRARAKKVVARYKDEGKNKGKRFNIFWSNVETLKPTLFSQIPNPDVRRRFRDQDPVGKIGSEIVERALSYALDDYDAAEVYEGVRDDGLIAGRGQAWIEYEPIINRERPELVEAMDPMGSDPMETPMGAMQPPMDAMQAPVDGMMPGLEQMQPPIEAPRYMLGDREVEPDGEDDEGPYIDEKVDERVYCVSVPWRLFRHAPEAQWKDVWWVARGHMMTRDDLHENFDESLGARKVKDLPIRKSGEDEKEDRGEALVWEIWDRNVRKVYWVHDTWKEEILKEAEDPLNLGDFFPCPEPFTPIRTTDDWTPIPEYVLYQDQAEEVDSISQRIHAMVGAFKPRGAYAEGMEGMIDVLKGDEMDLVPIKNWEQFLQNGGLQNGVMWLPLDVLANAIAALYEARDQSKQELYEITGISDVIRGSTKASETATAQQLKGNFGSMRMQPRQVPFARFIRDTLRIMAEIIAEHYSAETLHRMTGLDVPPEVMEMLRSDKLRGYKIDVETDSTIQADQAAEREALVEFVSSVTQYLQGAGPIIQASPSMAKPLMEILKMSARQFKAGRPVEDALDEAADAVIQQAQQPPPDPNRAEAEAEMQKAQMQAQTAMQTAQVKAQTDMQAAQAQMALDREKMQMEAQTEMQKAQIDRETDLEKARMGADVDITRAEIQSRQQREV